MYLVTEHVKMVNPDIAIAPLVENPKNIMQKDTTIPPPPIPAIVEIVIIKMSKAKPMNSIPRIGKIVLCLQSLVILSHIMKG
jgi:hypothetical protein